MKVSVNWVRDINRRYQCSADPMPDGIDKLVEKIGAQLGAVDEVVDLGKKYEGIVIAKIVSCSKHPDADKLSICMIDDGGVIKGLKRNKDGLVQVVCGAPNARATLAVAWIPPGVVVPATADKDPLVLESREIRAETSNGMLASPKELALGDAHEGILEIDEPAKPGQSFAELYGLNDYIIDIENKMFTHRPDLFGMLGVARELAGIQGHVFKSPGWYSLEAILPASKVKKLELKVQNDLENLVPRFTMLPISNVSVKPSPLWLQARLNSVGVRPINNIVDLTNFFMLETAQPLHAYDYDKVKSLSGGKAKIKVRLSKQGEQLTLLGGKKIKLRRGAVIIATDKQAIGLGGIMGGEQTEVDQNTKNIILEAGTFDMNLTRKTAMSYGLFTDAATRFTKNQSPWQNRAVIAKAADDICRLAGGRVAGALIDIKRKLPPNKPVNVAASFINERLGLSLNPSQIKKLLQNVEFKTAVNGEKMSITAPFWRTDIEIAEDIVEEVGRLHGYDRLPLVLPPRDTSPAVEDQKLQFKSKLRSLLAASGANEVLTYSFVHKSLLDSSAQDSKDAYHIRNALTPELQYYRLSLTPSLLEKIHPNIKSGFDKFLLFELGLTHVKGVLDAHGLPREMGRLSVVTASKDKAVDAPFYAPRRLLDYLFEKLNIKEVDFIPLSQRSKLEKQWSIAAAAYEPSRTAAVAIDGNVLGLVGEPRQPLRLSLKLPANTAMLELDLDRLEEQSSAGDYSPLNKYPEIMQDICFKTDFDMSYRHLNKLILGETLKIASSVGYLWTLKPLDIFAKKGDTIHKQITWRLTLAHPGRTLTTDEANRFLDSLAKAVQSVAGATRV